MTNVSFISQLLAAKSLSQPSKNSGCVRLHALAVRGTNQLTDRFS